MIRHQQRRGQKLPPGVKSVARPSRWGNPYKLGNLMMFDRPGPQEPRPATLAEVISEYEKLARKKLLQNPEWLDPLRDATGIACYCPLDQPCHADVLIEILEGDIGWCGCGDGLPTPGMVICANCECFEEMSQTAWADQ